MPLPHDRPIPRLTRDSLESVMASRVLTTREKNYVLNRVVGEYAAYALLSHLDEVERHESAELNDEIPRSWRSIDEDTKHRYRNMLSILTESNESFALSQVNWNWLTLKAMRSLQDAARESDDELRDVVGPSLERSIASDEEWKAYVNRLKPELPVHRDAVTQETDVAIERRSELIRRRYAREIHPETPYLNDYADAACRYDQQEMYDNVLRAQRHLDPTYAPSLQARQAAMTSVVATHVRPDKYDIIAALENGDFQDLLDRTVMPEDEFDVLMSDAMDVYVEDHRGDPDALEQATTLMDTAERHAQRPIVWRQSDARDLLREEQELRDEQVGAYDNNGEPMTVDHDENGLPELTQIAPATPLSIEDMEIEHRQREAELDELEAQGLITDDDRDEVDVSFGYGDTLGYEALKKLEEEAEEQRKVEESRRAMDFDL